jgi:glycerol kinase
MTTYILSIDQGTTSSRALLFDKNYQIAGAGQHEFAQHFPADGWVEHNPKDIWQTTKTAIRDAMENAEINSSDIAAIGITNQRETTLVWDRATGEPLYNAIVWQDRRTASRCEGLKLQGHESLVSEKTGLLLDPYFSVTKIAWILEHVDGARQRAERGELAFGTVDSFLLWKLTNGKVHATDATNASRTALYNIHSNCWDEELLDLFQVPRAMLPEVKDNSGNFGVATNDLFDSPVPITGMAGDQQSAAIGQACFKPGMMKSTYGTGCFALLNTGKVCHRSSNRLLSTIAYRLDGQTSYALEGSIFIAGAAIQWLRDGLGLISTAAEGTELAHSADTDQSVFMVPAFTGLGAPHWDSEARGAIFGITRNTGPKELARAALEAVCYQTTDLVTAMKADWPALEESELKVRVDGGMSGSDWTMQFLADILDSTVERPPVLETTALGAAYLAGRHVGFYPDLEAFSKHWTCDRRFEPHLDSSERKIRLSGWHDAVRRTLSKAPD